MNALRILLIEDEARLANSVKQGLVEDGFAVEIAGSAEAAEPIIARGALDLIVLDIGLPGRAGSNCCARCARRAIRRPC